MANPPVPARIPSAVRRRLYRQDVWGAWGSPVQTYWGYSASLVEDGTWLLHGPRGEPLGAAATYREALSRIAHLR